MNLNPHARHLPMVAAMVGGKLGVSVEFNNCQTAETNGKTIFVPEMAAAGTQEDAILLEGLIDHEAAHVRYSDFGIQLDKEPLVNALTAVMEDVRIERLLAQKYPGTKTNIENALRILSERGRFSIKGPKHDDDMSVVLRNAVLSRLRFDVLGQSLLEDSAREHYAAVEGKFGTILTDQIMDTAVSATYMMSESEVQATARQIHGLIQAAAENPPPDEPEEGDDKSDDQNDADDDQKSENSDGDADDKSKGKSKDGNQDGKSEPANVQSTGQPQEKADGKSGSSAPGQPSHSQIAQAATDLLSELKDNATAQALVESSDFGEAVKNEFPDFGKTFKGPATDAAPGGKSFGRGRSVLCGAKWEKSDLELLARQMVAGLDRRLETLLESRIETMRQIMRSGRLMGSRLSRLAVGSQEVFYRETEEDGLNTVVLVVEDFSASMKKHDVVHAGGEISRETAAAAATYALTRTCSRLNVPFGVVQFDSGKKLIGTLGGGTGPVKGLLKNPSGGTDTPSALRGAADLLAYREEQRKLIILIIDGDDDVAEMEAVLAETLRRGIEVAGVFIGNEGHGIQALFGKDGSRVTDSSSLTTALFSAFANILK